MSSGPQGSGPRDPGDPGDSDREWFAALSGEVPLEGASPAAREGLALRVAVAQRRRELEGAEPGEEEMELARERLFERAEREGLLEAVAPPPAPASNVVEFPFWRRRRPMLALAASFLLGVVVLQQVVNRPDYPEAPVTLGGAAVLTASAPQPKAAAETLAAQLKAAGLRPGLYQRRKTYIVDVQLMAAELPAATPAFQALGLAPAAGFNRVEISPP